MRHRIILGAVAIAGIAISACTDRLTAPPDASVGYVTTATVAIMNPRTHTLENYVAPRDGSVPGVSATVASPVPPPPVVVASTAPGLAPRSPNGRSNYEFVDDKGHKQQVSLMYGTSVNAPPIGMQHYTDGVLVSTTAYTWLRTPTGWFRSKSVMQAVMQGKAIGAPYTTLATYTQVTKPCNPKIDPSCGPAQTVRLEHTPASDRLMLAVNKTLYAMMLAGSTDANAQGFSFAFCATEWVVYAATSFVLAAAAMALAACPECGATEAAFAAAVAAVAAAEDRLISCMLSDPNGGGYGWSGTGGGGGGSGGGTPLSCTPANINNSCLIVWTK